MKTRRHRSTRRISTAASVVLLLLAIPTALANEPAAAAHATAQGAAAVDPAVPATLRSIIAKQLKVDEKKVTATASFVKDLGADELDLVELVMAYEREFKIAIRDADADQFHHVRDVVAYLRKRGVLK